MRRVNRLLKKMKARGQEILRKNRFSDQNEQLISQTVKVLPKHLIDKLRDDQASDPKQQDGSNNDQNKVAAASTTAGATTTTAPSATSGSN